MSDSEWLHAVLERMQADINEIKSDVRHLHEFKFKLAGGAIVLSSLLTLAINVIAIWFRF